MKRSVTLVAIAVALLVQRPLFAEKKEKALSDADFLTKAVVAGVCEVKLGDYAAKNASSEKVRDYAKHLTLDHTKANDRLTEYAKRQKLAVVAGQEKDTREKLERLAKLKGNDFDREFIKMMIDDHMKAISLFESESKNGTDPDLKTFAADTLPTLRKHLEEARKLAKDVNPK